MQSPRCARDQRNRYDELAPPSRVALAKTFTMDFGLRCMSYERDTLLNISLISSRSSSVRISMNDGVGLVSGYFDIRLNARATNSEGATR